MNYWPPLDKTGSETAELLDIAESCWDVDFPGWEWVAEKLNQRHKNNRTPQACRSKYGRIIRGAIRLNNTKDKTKGDQQ